MATLPERTKGERYTPASLRAGRVLDYSDPVTAACGIRSYLERRGELMAKHGPVRVLVENGRVLARPKVIET